MNERRSAVIVTVLPALLTWVRERGIRRPYFPEQDCIWLIPPVSSFNDGALERYLQQLQTRILSAELERFGPDLVPAIVADHTFDELFRVDVRDDVIVAPAPEDMAQIVATKTKAILTDSDVEYEKLRAYYGGPESVVKVLAWSTEPSPTDGKAIETVEVKIATRTSKALPEVLPRFTACVQLVIPSQLVECLTKSNLPPNLEGISLLGKRRVSWPRGLVLPGIERLGVDENTLLIDADDLPNLQSLGLALDAKRERLALIDRLEGLSHVSIMNANEPSVFDSLARHPLTSLGLSGRKLTTIDEIVRLEALEDLKLLDLSSLRSIAPLKELPRLQRLAIFRCKHIADAARVLPALEHLERLEVVSCGNLGLAPVLGDIKARVPEVLVGATR